MKYRSFLSLGILFCLCFTACTPTAPQTPETPNASASPETPASSSTGGRVFTESEIDAGISCFEASSNTLIKASGGQFRFGFESTRRNKGLLEASKWQDYLNTLGNSMIALQAQAEGEVCLP